MGEPPAHKKPGCAYPTIQSCIVKFISTWQVGQARTNFVKKIARLRAEFDGGIDPFPEALVAQAERLFTELLASTNEMALLHGDLHYWNILAAQRQDWLAIDPKGVVGDPAFEPSAWLLNPKPPALSGPDLKRQLRRRVDQFVEQLALDRERVLGWGIARVVLSAWWSYDDHAYHPGKS